MFDGQKTHLIVLSSVDCYNAFQKYVRLKNSGDLPIDEQDTLCPISNDHQTHSRWYPGIEGKIYNLGERKVRTFRDWAELFAEEARHQFDYHLLPDDLLYSAPELRKAPLGHLIFDSGLYERETGFQPPYSLSEAIRETFHWAKENPDKIGVSLDYRKEEEIFQQYSLYIG